MVSIYRIDTVEQADCGVWSIRIHPFNQDIFYTEDSALSPMSERCEELEKFNNAGMEIHVGPISKQASVPSSPAESRADGGSVCLWRTNKHSKWSVDISITKS